MVLLYCNYFLLLLCFSCHVISVVRISKYYRQMSHAVALFRAHVLYSAFIITVYTFEVMCTVLPIVA
jgi:hypothetical protein